LIFPVCGKTSSKALVVLKEEMEKSSRGNGGDTILKHLNMINSKIYKW